MRRRTSTPSRGHRARRGEYLGGVRVHLDHRCPGDPVARAIAVFERLGMHRTDGRNGVLVYAAIADRKLAVIGDLEIHGRVGDAYWQEVVDGMTRHLAGERTRTFPCTPSASSARS